MTNFFLQLDQDCLLLINGWHSPWLDFLMWVLSSKWINLPLAVCLVWLLKQHFSWKKTGLLFFLTLVVVASSDLISTHLFKDIFQRLRPSHEPLLQAKLYFHTLANSKPYLGGKYGFVSSHAANLFAVLAFLWTSIRVNRGVAAAFIIYAFLVIMSRVYLGVHYPSDVVAGALLGLLIGWFLRKIIVSKILVKWV
ncbi:MAG: hypothetical protein RLZZ65_850 [Bacteroidota bacterium]|jgi:undecaprenyl-diphosphatase